MSRRGIDKRVPPTHPHTHTHLRSADTPRRTRVGGRLHVRRLHIFALEVCVSVSLSMGLLLSSLLFCLLFCFVFFSSGIIQSQIDKDGMRHSRQQSALSRHLGITKDKEGGLRDILKSFNFNQYRFPHKQHHNNAGGATQLPYSSLFYFASLHDFQGSS